MSPFLTILRGSPLLILLMLVAACGGEDTPALPTESVTAPLAPPAPIMAPSLPRLSAGPHLGMITGFDPLDRSRELVAQARFAEARSAGASIGRIQIDWSELETAPGVFDEAALDQAFADPVLSGMNLIVLISTLDSDGLTLPDYLTEGERLRDGLTLASPEVSDAFLDFLTWLAPRLEQRNVWLVSIGNEVLGPIEDGLASEADAVTFYSAAFDQWNDQVPDIGITLTFTLSAPFGIPALFEAVRSRSDIATFNYYCLTSELTVTGEAQWQADLADMKASAGDREIFLQELGCPVGYSPQGGETQIGGSIDTQIAFFAFFGEQIANDPQLRAATLFQLFDWSPELAASFSQPLRDAGEVLIADRLEEWLATVGLVRWSDVQNRPAWDIWLTQVAGVADARGQ